LSRAKPEFKDKAVHAPQVKKTKASQRQRAVSSGFLGALLMKVRTGRSVTGEARSKHTQTTHLWAVNNRPVVGQISLSGH